MHRIIKFLSHFIFQLLVQLGVQKLFSAQSHEHATSEPLDHDSRVLPSSVALLQDFLEEEINPPPPLDSQQYLHVRLFIELFLFFLLLFSELHALQLLVVLLCLRLADFGELLLSFLFFDNTPFLQFLEQMTGIPGLIPDPYFMGAGIHKTLNGGHLDIHADFNLHKQMNVERRLNVLIYLNDDWQEDWGGCFEIWDKEMTRMEARFAPTFNRMVCFSTGSDTFHGNPEPVNHPKGEPRQSIALLCRDTSVPCTG